MRIEELSIGDWVRHTFYEENVQIARIDGDSERVLAERGKLSISCHLNHFEPIPLTPEILEKNGFKIDRLSGWHIYETQNGLRTTVWLGKNRDGKIEVSSQSIFDLETYECFLRVELNNIAVHDLLHALHLAGIEKEIEV